MVRFGQRIGVVGGSGSGKTFVAQALAAKLGLPYVCNDAIIWRPNWTPTPRAERVALFREALAGEAFTYDGNFSSMKDEEDAFIVARLDTLIWLDLPRRVVWPRLLRRTVMRAWTQQPLWHGNRESFRMSFASRDSILLWSLRTHQRYRRAYGDRVATDSRFAHLRVHRLRTAAAVSALLAAAGPDDK